MAQRCPLTSSQDRSGCSMQMPMRGRSNQARNLASLSRMATASIRRRVSAWSWCLKSWSRSDMVLTEWASSANSSRPWMGMRESRRPSATDWTPSCRATSRRAMRRAMWMELAKIRRHRDTATTAVAMARRWKARSTRARRASRRAAASSRTATSFNKSWLVSRLSSSSSRGSGASAVARRSEPATMRWKRLAVASRLQLRWARAFCSASLLNSSRAWRSTSLEAFRFWSQRAWTRASR